MKETKEKLPNYINQFSVYEQDNGQMCMVISNNKNNINAKNFLCAKVVTEDEDDIPYHINYDSYICNTIVSHKILLECTLPVYSSRLKRYLYTVSAGTIEKIKIGLGELLFGEQVYTLTEARSAIAVEDLRLKVEFEKKFNMQSQIPTISYMNGLTNPTFDEPAAYNNADIDVNKIPLPDLPEMDISFPLPDEELEKEILAAANYKGSDIKEIITAPTIVGDVEKAQEYMAKIEAKKEKEITSVTMTDKATCVVVNKRGRKKKSLVDKPREEIKLEVENSDHEEDVIEKNMIIIDSLPQVEEGKRKSYNYIYSNGVYLQFLEDYKNLSKEEMSIKYGAETKNLGNICYRCKQLAKNNGEEELVELIGYSYRTYDKKGE